MNNLRFGQNFIVKKTGDLSDPPQRYHFFQKPKCLDRKVDHSEPSRIFDALIIENGLWFELVIVRD